MRTIRCLFVLGVTASLQPVLAQENGGHPNMTARGANFMEGRIFADKQDKAMRDACAKTGCLFIVNRSKDQDIVALQFDTVAPGAAHEPVWSKNTLRGPIRPQHTVALMKFGDATLCGLPAKLQLKDRRDGTVEELRGVMSLCPQPGADVFSVGTAPGSGQP